MELERKQTIWVWRFMIALILGVLAAIICPKDYVEE